MNGMQRIAFSQMEKTSYADRHLDRQTPSQSTSQPASRLVGWLVGWMALFSSTSRDPHTAQRGLKKMKKKKQAKRPQQPVVQQIKNYLQISQPSAMSLWSVNERYSRWEKETERHKNTKARDWKPASQQPSRSPVENFLIPRYKQAKTHHHHHHQKQQQHVNKHRPKNLPTVHHQWHRQENGEWRGGREKSRQTQTS
ncbi:hypothetical protein T07_12437 [Trichinella nelsoni]|uniref:Uncharacterized protein n=1 Tax=Trichinella nelsoni TaxID=6336 RepID=A0A0V0S7A6_9BILA|nr:hypothetical protein T07_12437 [Trichinella nelsoni]